MKKFLKTSETDACYAKNAEFVRWVIVNGQYNENMSTTELVISVFYHCWKKSIPPADLHKTWPNIAYADYRSTSS